MPRTKHAIAPRKAKRGSSSSQETVVSRVFDDFDASSDTLVSPLSEYPDDLSDCSEARVEKETTRSLDRPGSESESRGPPEATDQGREPVQTNSSSPEHSDEGVEEWAREKKRPALRDGRNPCAGAPPQPSTRTVKSSKLTADRNVLPLALATDAKPGKNFPDPKHTRRRGHHNGSDNVATATPRRSGRTRRPPPKYTSAESTRCRVAPSSPKSKSLIVRLKCLERNTVHNADKQIFASSSPSTPQKRFKRKRTAAQSNAIPRKRLRLSQMPFGDPHSMSLNFAASPNKKMADTQSMNLDKQFSRLRSPTVSPPSLASNPQKNMNGDTQATLDAVALPGESSLESLPSTITVEGLRDLASRLLADRNINAPKPEPAFQPEVWADTRMELCETLPYYRAYHGGSYHTDGFTRAFLFAKHGHPRDYIDASVIVSCAGGGRSKDRDSGQMTIERDQKENASVDSLRNSLNQFNPVVIITSADNPYIPSKFPHEYCVLDYFKPVDIWWEKSKGKKLLRYRFEKLNSKKPSWWQPKGTKGITRPGSLAAPVTHLCSYCGKESEQVYLLSWMCLIPDCPAFWKLVSSSGELREPQEDSLLYDPRFLKKTTTWPNDDHAYPLVPIDAEVSSHSVAGEDCSLAHWAGKVCPLCGRCNARLSWTGWECQNPGCTFTKKVPHTLIPAAAIRELFFPFNNSYTMARDIYRSPVKLSVSFAHNYRIHRYEIPGIAGFVTHMIANKRIVEECGGPDAMFEELQRSDIGLRRRPIGGEARKDKYYTRHYSVNFGMPYKFVAATASSPFEGVAQPITATRSRLNWAAKVLLAQEEGKSVEEVGERWASTEFNEVLALGYFEQQKISYHDDGEFGLGPTIATLSLGATGTMRLRMKAKHYHGVSKSDNYNDSLPLPGCVAYESRLKLHDSLQTLKQQDKKAYDVRLKQIPKELNLKSNGHARDAIVMTLGHGDIVVMHGATLQKYYEHSVDHAGKLRFALTCRYIDPDSLKPEDKPAYDVGPDTGNYDGSKLPAAA